MANEKYGLSEVINLINGRMSNATPGTAVFAELAKIKETIYQNLLSTRMEASFPPARDFIKEVTEKRFNPDFWKVGDAYSMSKPIILAAPPIDEMAKSNVIPYINLESSIIDEKKLKGFKEGTIFDWKKNYIFPIVSRGKSWFWLKMLMMEQYYAEQQKIVISDMSNHDKPNLSNVIWWNLPLILYAVKVIKDEELDELSDESIPYVDVIVRKVILDIDPWRDALRHFGRNYTEDLKISKWHRIYVTKEMCPSMSDDEINYMNHIWNDLFDQSYTPDFNNNKPKNSWLERKTKRGK